ncbi:YeeE/YedE family protein, partial [Serratia marcescens]|uniref:YeeE/YedE family protein n=1 Tax=Serratia marcescens TaxID=615 RepID=UPI00356B6ADB
WLIPPWLLPPAGGWPWAETGAGGGGGGGAGLLVGVGTRLGSGCTSGHGVCGVARRAPRSLAATAVFMLLGFTTVWLMRHLLGG